MTKTTHFYKAQRQKFLLNVKSQLGRTWSKPLVCYKIDLDAGREAFIYSDVEQVVLIPDGRGEGIESEPGCYHS